MENADPGYHSTKLAIFSHILMHRKCTVDQDWLRKRLNPAFQTVVQFFKRGLLKKIIIK